MASSDYVTITIEGVGGHGALPHRTADPVVAACSIVMALQTVVARNVDPISSAVVTVGAVNAGKANNVIPQNATLLLGVRAGDPATREILQRRITALVHAQAEGYGVRATIDYQVGYPVLVNSAAETDFARQVAAELVGSEQIVHQGAAQTSSEDFAYMLEQVPGSYLWIGNGAGDSAGACMVHNPGYDFNDAILPLGAAYWVLMARRFLA